MRGKKVLGRDSKKPPTTKNGKEIISTISFSETKRGPDCSDKLGERGQRSGRGEKEPLIKSHKRARNTKTGDGHTSPRPTAIFP